MLRWRWRALAQNHDRERIRGFLQFLLSDVLFSTHLDIWLNSPGDVRLFADVNAAHGVDFRSSIETLALGDLFEPKPRTFLVSVKLVLADYVFSGDDPKRWWERYLGFENLNAVRDFVDIDFTGLAK